MKTIWPKQKTNSSDTLIGNKYGDSEVISLISSGEEGRIWELKCCCGNTYQATTKVLNKGRKQHCGCLRNFPMPGKSFGNGIIIKEDGRNKNGQKLWLLQCKCGKQYKTHTAYLLNGHTKSCGCYRLEKLGIPLGLKISYTWFKNYIKSARERKLDFELTIQDIVDLFDLQNGKCVLTGRKLILPTSSEIYKTNQYTASIDRKNNSIGYTKDNIQIVHKQVNMVKWTLSNEDFINLCKEVSNNVK